jgi:hypothetical protein
MKTACFVTLFWLLLTANALAENEAVNPSEQLIALAERSYCSSSEEKWLEDEAGRKYCVKALPKVEGLYRKSADESRVRLLGAYSLELIREDDTTLYTKFYKTVASKPIGPSPLTPEEKKKKLAGYSVVLPASETITLGEFDTGLPQRGQWRNGFAFVDLNNNARLDLILPPARKSGRGPLAYMNQGSGRWQQNEALSFEPADYDYGGVSVLNLNQDEAADLVFASHLKGLTALVRNGEVFQLWEPGTKTLNTSMFSSRVVVAGDWDGDGKSDIITFGEGPRISGSNSKAEESSRGLRVYLNRGESGFQELAEEGGEKRLFGDGLAIGDLNADGKLDAVSSSSVMGGTEIIYFGKGSAGWAVASLDGLPPSSLVQAVIIDDLNGDRRPDIALSFSSFEAETWISGIKIFFAAPDGTWKPQLLFAKESRSAVYALASGDLNADQKRDIAAFDAKGEGYLFLGRGNGEFSAEAAPELLNAGRGCRAYSAGLQDIDGDGKDELFAGFAGDSSGTAAESEEKCENNGRLGLWKVR